VSPRVAKKPKSDDMMLSGLVASSDQIWDQDMILAGAGTGAVVVVVLGGDMIDGPLLVIGGGLLAGLDM
jgi:hypothetical protein